MLTLAFSIGLLALAFVAHLVIWRIRLPSNHTLALLIVFFLTPIAALAVPHGVSPTRLMLDWAHWALIAMVYTPCALTYIGLYSMLEHRSPTLDLVEHVHAAPGGRVALEDLRAKASAAAMMETRLAHFEQGGVVRRDGDSLTLTRSGAVLAFLFNVTGNILGARGVG